MPVSWLREARFMMHMPHTIGSHLISRVLPRAGLERQLESLNQPRWRREAILSQGPGKEVSCAEKFSLQRVVEAPCFRLHGPFPHTYLTARLGDNRLELDHASSPTKQAVELDISTILSVISKGPCTQSVAACQAIAGAQVMCERSCHQRDINCDE